MLLAGNRRVFLKSLGIGAGAFVLSSLTAPKRARAEGAGRSFVFCYFRGGWDILMGLDPRDPNVFTDARKMETRIELGWDRLPAIYPRTLIQPSGSNIEFGPAMGGIAEHFSKMCIVRGMTMDTVAHEIGRLYFQTGMAPRGAQPAGSATATRIVAQQGDHSPLPNLTARVETFNQGLPTFATGQQVNSVQDLIQLLNDGPKAPAGRIRARLDEYRARVNRCDPAGLDRQGFLGLLQQSQIKARAVVEGRLSDKFQFLANNNPEMTGLKTRYRIAQLASPEAQAAMAYQALKYGMAQCVSIELANGCDTHDTSWTTRQPQQQSAGFSALGALVSDLQSTDDPVRGGKLLDHTTILGFSEFGRTALINQRGGRDHSLTASCLLIGAGVPGNKVVGKSSDVGHVPMAVNPRTGAPEDGGTFLTPTLVTASIMDSAGYDTTALRTRGLPCLMA